MTSRDLNIVHRPGKSPPVKMTANATNRSVMLSHRLLPSEILNDEKAFQ